MSDAPERIYLNLGNEETTYAEAVAAGWEVSWCEGEQDEWDVEYVRADLYEQRGERIAELQAEVERTKASAICYVSHNIHWLGEKGALGWCLGCGKHRSLIRETQPPQEQSNEN